MSKKANANLHKAKANKKDEFYTRLGDIENELKYYKEHFKDKVVYCNCDDPLASNFFVYFFMNFKHLGLKELITACYKSMNFKELSKEDSPKKAYAIRIHKSSGVNPQIHSLKDIEELLELSLSNGEKQSEKTLKQFEANKHKLEQCFVGLKPDKIKLETLFEDEEKDNAGDFRSGDCIELLKEADIVVTNPPFSLFREYVSQLVEYKKKFVIIGNVNAVSYKEIFSLIKDGKLWLGASIKSGDRKFYVPDTFPLNAAGCGVEKIMQNGKEVEKKFIRVKGVRWYTNLDYPKRSEILETIYTYEKYKDKYPKYDNYDAINVDKTNEIPIDYKGVMGVPITFLDKHNPKQFEIVALGIVGSIDFTCEKKMEILDKFGKSTGKFTINAKGTLYKKYNPQIDKKPPAFKDCENGELYSSIYARILIRQIATVKELKKQREEKL